MSNFFKKYLLIGIFLGLAPSVFAMENSQNYRWPLNIITGLWSRIPSIPSTLWGWNIRKKTEDEEISQILQTNLNGWCLNVKQNWKKIETYLVQKTDINLTIDTDKISLLLLVALADKKPDINIIKNLIKQGADVNKYRFDNKALAHIDNHWAKMSGYTALAQAIDISLNTEDFQIIQELCNAGASIINIDNSDQTVLHRMAALQLPKEAFEIVLTHAYPNNQQQIMVMKIKNASSFVDNRISWLKEILQKTNKYGKTAAQVLSEICHKADQSYKNEILQLLDDSQLDKNYNILKQNHLEGALPEQKNLHIPIASGGLEKISKKANAEIVNIVEIALKKNGQLEKEDCKKIEECLLHGADPNLKIGPDNTPLLLLVAKYGKKYLFNYLLKLGADRDARDKNGWTPGGIKKANQDYTDKVGPLLNDKLLKDYIHKKEVNQNLAYEQTIAVKIAKYLLEELTKEGPLSENYQARDYVPFVADVIQKAVERYAPEKTEQINCVSLAAGDLENEFLLIRALRYVGYKTIRLAAIDIKYFESKIKEFTDKFEQWCVRRGIPVSTNPESPIQNGVNLTLFNDTYDYISQAVWHKFPKNHLLLMIQPGGTVRAKGTMLPSFDAAATNELGFFESSEENNSYIKIYFPYEQSEVFIDVNFAGKEEAIDKFKDIINKSRYITKKIPKKGKIHEELIAKSWNLRILINDLLKENQENFRIPNVTAGINLDTLFYDLIRATAMNPENPLAFEVGGLKIKELTDMSGSFQDVYTRYK